MPAGRKPKPPMTDPEAEAALQVLDGDGKGHGVRAAAILISRMRGAEDALDPAVRRRRSVSKDWVVRELHRRKMASVAKSDGAPQSAQASQNAGRLETRQTVHQTPGPGGAP